MAGFRSASALAAVLELRGYAATNLYEAERDNAIAPYHVLSEIAHVCGLPVEFFTADFSRLGEISDEPRAVIAREIAAAAQRSGLQPEESGEDSPPRTGEAL